MWRIILLLLSGSVVGLNSGDVSFVRNVALRKPAIQSSTFRDSAVMFGARLANDDSPLTCSKTKWSWTLFWRVDLQEMLPIGGANFTVRWEYFGRENRFLYRIQLQVGQENVPATPSCGVATVLLDRADNFPVEIICERITPGRFVTINIEPHYAGTVSTGSPQLTLCDVQIFSIINATTADNIAAASSLTENVLKSETVATAGGAPEVLLFATNTPFPLANATPTNQVNRTQRRLLKEPTASPAGRFGKILQKMPAQSTTRKRLIMLTTTTLPVNTTTESVVMMEDLPVERNKQAETDDEILYQLQSIRQDVTGKLISIYNYVVFSGAAIAILVILSVIAGILLLWRYTLTRTHLTGSSRGTSITQDFSFKAPSPPMTQLAPLPLIPPSASQPTRHLPRASHQYLKSFPKDSVPKAPHRSF
ncbi:uncharacterized protein LOC129595339 [Paramacrobiotus metropolitanus]|uniref:uncharacterized protein LOC129595339 n=1 Tax=Paramacrobiotus metropolitanus TaxID=2943436 RepID=UPI002445F6E1|nr:uncharacterized protein LOC129595339 [Paramacrobiotus metropolitanus]